MNKFKSAFLTLIVTSSLTIGYSASTLAIGIPTIVSDPTAHAKLAEGISTANKIVRTANQQLSNLKYLKSQFEGNYGHGAGAANDLNQITSNLKDAAKTIFKINSGSDDIDFTSYEEVLRKVNGIFDASDNAQLINMSEDQRNEFRQRVYKSNIASSQQTLANAEKRFSKIKELMDRSDKTKNIKESSDLSNRLLGEIAAILTEMQISIAQLNHSESVAKYIGVDENKAPKKKIKYGSGITDADIAESRRKRQEADQAIFGNILKKKYIE